MSPERREGAVVAARYSLDRKLGEGGFAEVWAATHRVTRRQVAIKFLKERHSSDERARQRFVQEARAASAVRHPNVIVIHDVFEDAGIPMMIMDLLEGETLGDQLQREQVLPLGQVATIMLPVISAVHAAHSLGILHRDLKPHNIFLAKRSAVDKDGPAEVKVLDFGIAKLLTPEILGAPSGGLTNSGVTLGTPFYMSPEQFFGDGEIDHRSDIWAIGVIAYECLAGLRPTEGKTVGLVVRAIMNESITPLASRRPELPGEVTDIVMRALSFDCAKRPAMREIAQVLRPYTSVDVPSLDVSRERTLPSIRAEAPRISLGPGAPLDRNSGSQAPVTWADAPSGKPTRAPFWAAVVTGGLVSCGAGLFAWHIATGTVAAVSTQGRDQAAPAATGLEHPAQRPVTEEPLASVIAFSSQDVGAVPDGSVPSPAPSAAAAHAGTRLPAAGTKGQFAPTPTPTASVAVQPFDPGSVR